MHYDAAIIGAGMSGLGAGIRLAHFGRRVVILERHYAYGGLNSYYTLDGRQYDVGLHALTNYVPPGTPGKPMTKLLRQLRLDRSALQLCPQRWSEILHSGLRLRFGNGPELLTCEIREKFPAQADGFAALLHEIDSCDDLALEITPRSARAVVRSFIDDDALASALMIGPMYYGCPDEHDMDFTQYATIFKSVFCEGLARPRAGVRAIITALVKRFRACGGRIMMQRGVSRIELQNGRAAALVLDNGERLTADRVFSSAGCVETMRLCGQRNHEEADRSAANVGRVSFVEAIAVLNCKPAELGFGAAVMFFNDAPVFEYAAPEQTVDLRSGVICSPNNYEDHEHLHEGVLRITCLANPYHWMSLSGEAYRREKEKELPRLLARLEQAAPGLSRHLVCTDMFTPATIARFTGHLNGAVYGSPVKKRNGRTDIENLFLIGTDQGYLGVIGAILSGITMANIHGLGAHLPP